MGYGLIGETTIETKEQNMTSVKSLLIQKVKAGRKL
jgi:hypothetical protein